MTTKKIGLLLGDENDWPSAFEGLHSRLNRSINYRGSSYNIDVERIRIHPFKLTAPANYNVVIDRLGYWHYNPREWLKKAALMNGTYLLNNPFTFQSMEKHSAYCAMERMGMHIPETWLIPQREAPADKPEKYAVTAERYHDLFDLPAIAAEIGYPLYMKPFDGGGWRGVSRVNDAEELMEAYNSSGQMLMHLQQGLDNFDVFVRSLAIGPQVISLNYDPAQPQHGRYVIDHGFLSAEKGTEAQSITKIINAFFRWDFNSCEAILKNGILHPIDFANACPDIAVTSLHYYFPWAIKSLLAWSIFSAVSARPMDIAMDPTEYFVIADSGASYEEKIAQYTALADAHLQTEEFNAFRATQLGDLDAIMWEYIGSADFDHMLLETIRGQFPAHEHDEFIAHYRGIMQHWRDANPA
ncbi:MAG: ATP-grasp domain-containing protein [Candidatus Promineifilaceae bacterium]